MKKKFIIIFAITLLSTVCGNASEYEQIDLKTAIEIAQKNNLDIKTSKMDVDIAKNDIKISNRLQNPALQTFWNFGEAGKGNPNQIGLAQTIELFKRTPRKKLAKANYNLAAHNFEYQKFNLKMDVAEAYVKLVVAKSILKKYEHQQAFLEKLLKISNKNDTSHAKLDLDTIEAKIALNQMITEVNKARTNAKTARIEFNRIINTMDGKYDVPDLDLLKNEDKIDINLPSVTTELPKYQQIEESAFKNRYDVSIAQHQIEIAEKKLAVVVRQRVPDIEIEGGYGYQTVGASESNKYKAGAYLGANLVNLPVLYTYKPEIKNAKLEVEKAKINYTSTVNKAKKDIEIAYENFVTAQLNLNSYNDEILKDSKNLFDLFEEIYNVEKVDFATLAAIEESYSDLIVGYSEALSDYYISWINFLREINTDNFNCTPENI